MEKLLIISALIALMFFILKMLEMKYIDKEMKPLKNVIRDSVFVFVASLGCLFVFLNFNGSINDFMSIITADKSGNLKATEIFTDEPGF
uniref:Uncharacterized protein n=1 Tax=viral metagenome TaxID=1070528 RepID=A0A6C0FF75_9ZZZZ|tara:strand:+ start:51668 stop:51934 length:267 start_codon:yes stop_codon:yes gene_type:complete